MTRQSIDTDLTPAQVSALILLLDTPTQWTRSSNGTLAVATGEALVRRGLVTSRTFARTARGRDSAYRITGRGIIAARRLTPAGAGQ